MATEEEQRKLGLEVVGYFASNPRLKFDKFAGLGRHGGALLMEEKGMDGAPGRKLVIKYSLGSLATDQQRDADDDLRNEYRWLKMLRGCEHIVQLIDMADCSLLLPGISNGENTFEESKRRMQGIQQNQQREGEAVDGKTITKEPPIVRRCPTFALEFIEYGVITGFVDRLYYEQRMVPMRLQWSIWLCLVRQCVAMAFPPNIPDAEWRGQKIRERIIPGQEHFTLTQNSLHTDNLLFDKITPAEEADVEHAPGIPPLKLIDFGRGKLEDHTDREWILERLENTRECGSRINLCYAAYTMMGISCPLSHEDDLERLAEGKIYLFTKPDGEHSLVVTQAPDVLRESETMDRALRDTLVRCLAVDYGDMPSLGEVLAEAEYYVENRGPDADPELMERMALSEEHEDVIDFVLEFIHQPPLSELYAQEEERRGSQ